MARLTKAQLKEIEEKSLQIEEDFFQNTKLCRFQNLLELMSEVRFDDDGFQLAHDYMFEPIFLSPQFYKQTIKVILNTSNPFYCKNPLWHCTEYKNFLSNRLVFEDLEKYILDVIKEYDFSQQEAKRKAELLEIAKNKVKNNLTPEEFEALKEYTGKNLI
jgi:hypothetical protein